MNINIMSMFVIGILEIVLSIPLILEKVPPNWLYGFRTRKTVSSGGRTWYDANKFAGKSLTVAGILTVLAGGILLWMEPVITSQSIERISVLTIFIALFGSLVADFIYLRTL